MTKGNRKITFPYHTYFLTCKVVGWVDLFGRKHCRDILIQSLDFCIKNKGLNLYSFVIMTNHIHLVASANEETDGLSAIVRDFKKFTSREMITWMLATRKESRRHWMVNIFRNFGLQTYRNENFQIWEHYSHPELIKSNKALIRTIDYIHNNPVKAGIVRVPEDYIYSSAGNYSGRSDNILEVRVLDLGG